VTSSAYEFCRYEVDGPLLVLTIARPEVLNAFTPAAHREFSDAFNRYAADRDLRVAIITGSGDRAFCVGTDLKELARTGDDSKPETGFAGITHRFDLWKPVIAAVNGLCLGGGMEIIAACDIAIAAEHAEFGLPEPRVGLAALGGGLLQRLPRQIASKDAMWMILTGERISAERATQLRIVNEVVAGRDLPGRARTVAAMILAGAPLAIQASKQVALQSMAFADLATAMQADYSLVHKMLASDDAREGPRAFSEKRNPTWTGR